MKEYYLENIITSVIIIIVCLSVYSYLFDCIINFRYAIGNFTFFLLYLIQNLIFNSWIYLLYVAAYYYLTRNIKQGDHLVLKISVSLIIFYLLAGSMAKDDYSLSIGEYKYPKIKASYCLAVLTMVLYSEGKLSFNKKIE